jgi:hypothetical protein
MTQFAATAETRNSGGVTIRAATPPTRWAPLTGIAFVVFFLGGVVASNAPSDNASAASWMAAYTGGGRQFSHEASGVLLVLAALSLMSFLVTTWSRVGRLRPEGSHSAVPLAAAGVSAACIAVGGVLMALGSSVAHGFARSDPAATATLLRFTNDGGFIMVAVPGMLAAALAVAGLSLQAHRAGLFGRRMQVFGIVVALILLASLAFIPIAALLVWLVVTAIVLVRRSAPGSDVRTSS